MAIGDEGVTGPLVGGTRPTGIVDFVPRPRGRSLAPIPRGPRGAGRNRTALQAGIPRPAAPRVPTAGGVTPPRARAQANLARGGVPLRRVPTTPIPRPTRVSVPTALPTRVPRPTNVIQQGPAPSRTRAGQAGDARQLLREETERRERIRQGRGFRAVHGLRQ